ncbi:M23 family metallopeptidase [Oxynema sp. CENA135]|uniref:M23 family metallopeptidase n=1 Tax=Oxynema sp. CENA135 TaxID=984206 RepID=UPI00272E51DC|nr:peptidoglycan DD-metalloendopeptidase family protein [Oxynema sp. CENA135]
MSQRTQFARTPLSIVCQFSLLVQGFAWIPIAGSLDTDFNRAQAQTPSNPIDRLGSDDFVTEPVPSEAADPYSAPAPEPAPEPYAAPAQEQWQAAPEPAPEPYAAPAQEQWQAAPEPAPEPYAAPVEEYIPAEPIAAPPPGVSPETYPVNPSNTQVSGDYANVYIDPTDYSIGATDQIPASHYAEAEEAPSTVVFSENSTGCETVLQPGQVVSGAGCQPTAAASGTPYHHGNAASPQNYPVANEQPSAYSAQLNPQGGYSPNPISTAPNSSPVYNQAAPAYGVAAQPAPSQSAPGYNYVPPTPTGEIQPIPVGPVSIKRSGIHLATKASANHFDTRKLARPSGRPGNGDKSMIFPLSIPAPITSLFGWRTHPIFGNRQFHSGTDLGAAMGTPVLAAYTGQVAIADWLGGYGLTVVLEHNDATEETLYAHLSELLVQPGENVKQGQVIGRVGSTGNSTGPHLHFEWRQMTPEGWVTLDPGTQLEYALAQLVRSLEIADAQGSDELARTSQTLPNLPSEISGLLSGDRLVSSTAMPEIVVPANLDPVLEQFLATPGVNSEQQTSSLPPSSPAPLSSNRPQSSS